MDNKQAFFNDVINNLKKLDDRLKERIYKYYWGYLMAVAMRYVADREVAEEVVNDSFIKAFDHLPKFEIRKGTDFQVAFRAWLAQITARTALNHIRAHKRIPPTTEVTPDLLQESIANGADKLFQEDFAKLLNQLLPIHKTIFNMYEIEGFSHEEIAETMGIPASSSRVYLTRAKEKLRRLYHKVFA